MASEIKTDDCWLWAGYISPNGYGYVYAKGSGKGASPLIAHRIMYEEYKGQIPQNLTLDHLCRIRHCINPDHLEPVTIRVNVLRGDGPSAKNLKKTHCPQEHPYSVYAQVSRNNKGVARRCSICHAESEARRRIAKSQAN